MSTTHNEFGFVNPDGSVMSMSGGGYPGILAADYEESPTLEFHHEGEIIKYNDIYYITTDEIEQGSTLTVGTNIEVYQFDVTRTPVFVKGADDDNTIELNGDNYGGGGHTIIDASGTSMTARSGLKFGEGFNTADDSSNNQTVVTPNANVLAKQSEISDVILTGDKPSSAITEGKFFVDKNGLLRVATSSIGTTDDVDNTNSTVKSIGEVLGELNSNLAYKIGIPDYSNVIATITTHTATYTATQPCVLVGNIGDDSDGFVAQVSVNGTVVANGGVASATSTSFKVVAPIFIPINTGDIVTTRASRGIYDIKVLGYNS